MDDLRIAVRSLSKSPALSLAVIAVLALGIGASTAVFSVVDAVLLRPLPVRQPERLVVGWQQDLSADRELIEVSYPDFRDWRERSSSFESLAAFGSVNWAHTLTGAGEPAVLASAAVSASFFETLGTPPFLGRSFRESDDLPAAAQVAILSYPLWQRRFAGDPGIVGRTITLEGDTQGPEPFSVVGIMPRGFDLPRGAELWTPAGRRLAWAARQQTPEQQRSVDVLYVLGRLRAGVAAPAAQAELGAIARQLSSEHPSSFSATGVAVTPFEDYRLGGRTRAGLRALAGAVAIVLLIGFANAAGLLVVRGLARETETAVRLALGARRSALVRSSLAEAGVLVGAGTAGGLVIAWCATRLLVALAPDGLPRVQEASLSAEVLAAALAAALLSLVMAGLPPAILAWRGSLVASLKRSGAVAGGRWRSLSAFVVVETALAVVVMAAAGLLVRSYVRLSRVDLGYRPEGVLTLDVSPQESRYPAPGQQRRFVEELLERLRRGPDVVAAGAVTARPLRYGPIGFDTSFLLPGQTDAESARNPPLNWQAITPGGFHALGLPILDGRDFADFDDEAAARVVIVGQSLARRLWPGESAIGKRIFTGGGLWDRERKTPIFQVVVGVVADARFRELEATRLDVYVAMRQVDTLAGTLVVRSRADPSKLAPWVRAQVQALDPEVPLADLTALPAAVAAAVAPWRFNAAVVGLLAGLGCALAAVGLFGLVSYAASRRTRELAIRQALGARRRDIVNLMVGEGTRVALLGIGLGLALTLALAHRLSDLLYGVAPHDAGAFLGSVALLVLTALLASYLPARRAAMADPLRGLRAE